VTVELEEAVAIVRDALRGTGERNTVTDVRPALARLEAEPASKDESAVMDAYGPEPGACHGTHCREQGWHEPR
jgi:hypothetical protein